MSQEAFNTARSAILSLKQHRATPINPLGFEFVDTHVLHFPNGAHHLGATFQELKGAPEVVRVRTSNWRFEDEVDAVFTREEAREMYRKLVRVGFVAF